ncbi:hypothetical protein ACJ73_08407 [Blastomyces percursus]|uniref:Uncharacterized protein n=1 Tax=Blastomyces percursus TaxID=1658174 RepID=A0A1J9QWM8_9EURO|nr:hypothetical protein ACJ73_08407 [Blastomyces percursus]
MTPLNFDPPTRVLSKLRTKALQVEKGRTRAMENLGDMLKELIFAADVPNKSILYKCFKRYQACRSESNKERHYTHLDESERNINMPGAMAPTEAIPTRNIMAVAVGREMNASKLLKNSLQQHHSPMDKQQDRGSTYHCSKTLESTPPSTTTNSRSSGRSPATVDWSASTPAPPPDITGWGGNATAVCYGNASDSQLQAGNNGQHLRTPYTAENFTILDPDAPVPPGMIPAPTQSCTTPTPVTSIRPSLFPEEWEPEETPSFKLASHDVEEDPETITMLRECDPGKLTYEELKSDVAEVCNIIYETELRCLVEGVRMAHIPKLNEEQWKDLVECHRALLSHHCNLFMTTQHPAGDENFFTIPARHQTPSRLLDRGIYILLKFMEARRPDSHEYMVHFIYDAYSLMTVLIEVVPWFKYMWFECLGDLASYMMCLQERDSVEHRDWKSISSQWYHKAVDESPGKEVFTTDLSRVESAFKMALDSIQNQSVTTPDLPSWFVGSHAMLLRGGSIHRFIEYVQKYMALFDAQVRRQTFKFPEASICMGVPNIAAMLQYGEHDGILTRMFIDSQKLSLEVRFQHAMKHWLMLPMKPSQNILDKDLPSDAATFSTPLQKLTYSTYLNFHTLSFVLNDAQNEKIVPYVHPSLAFIWSLALVPDSMVYVEGEIPWAKITIFLNMLSRASVSESRLESVNFPIPTATKFRQLPEDFFFRGQIWSQTLYPSDFFADATMDDDSRGKDMPSTKSARNERCLWYGYRLASCGRWIQLFEENGVKKFRPTHYATQLEAAAIHPKVFRQRDDPTFLFIAAMNDRIDDMEHSKSIEKRLGKALDRLSYEICDPGRDGSDITRVRDIYKMLEDVKSKVEDTRILKECTMDKAEAALKKLVTSNDVDIITKAKANESVLRHQAYQHECEMECQHVESGDSCKKKTDAEKKTDDETIDRLAREFAAKIPDNLFSPAEILLSFLLERKPSPTDALADADSWVAKGQQRKGKAGELCSQRVIYRGTLADPTYSCLSVLCLYNGKFDVNGQSGRPSGDLSDKMLTRS